MGIKFKFHPLFFIYVFLCIYFGWFNHIFYYVVVVTLHEYAHLVVARHLGYEMNSLVFNLSGAGICGANNFKPKDEIKIAIAGPLVNLIFIIITIALFWIFPLSYLYTYDFLICNIVVMIFNILPIYPLDGGRIVVSCLVLKNKNKRRIIKISNILCFCLSAFFAILFIVSVLFKINYNLFITAIFLTLCGINNDKNTYFDKIYTLNKKLSSPMEIKVFRIKNMDKIDLLKYLNPNYYSIFKMIDPNGNEITIEENDLIK